MPAELIDGKAIAMQVREEVRREVAAWVADGNRAPGLATILVGDDPASDVYVSNKQRACREAGIVGFDHRLPADATDAEVRSLIERLNDDPTCSGILLQLPTPEPLDGTALSGLILPEKDVDGLTSASAGLLATGAPGLRPCTPSGVMELLRRHDVPLHGVDVTVLGRSHLVGRPVSEMLLAADATVTTCHQYTPDIVPSCRRADVLVVAIGKPELIRGEWLKPGATVIDVGINRTEKGIVGDVHLPSAMEVAGRITPVPGGVGPMTIAMLLRNTLQAARLQAGLELDTDAAWAGA